VLSRKRRRLYICKERRERGVLNQPPTGIFVVCTSCTEAWHVARPLCQPHTMVDAQADGGAGQTLSSPRYSTGALWTARETGGRRVFRRSTAPLENHIKNTETPGVHLLRTHGKKEDKSRHLPAPARALHHPTATPKKRNAQAAGQPPAAVAVTWASRQHAAGVVGSHGRGAAQGGEETAANGGRRGGRRHRWGADRGWATAIGGGGALRWGRQPEWRQRATGRQRSPVDDGGAADSCGAALVGGSFWR